MPFQQTSLWAFEEAKTDLGTKQLTVLEVIRNFPGADDQFISEKLKWPINRSVPRRNELLKMGRIKIVGKKKNFMTGRITMRYEVV